MDNPEVCPVSKGATRRATKAAKAASQEESPEQQLVYGMAWSRGRSTQAIADIAQIELKDRAV